MDSKTYLKDLFNHALNFCSPSNAIANVLSVKGNQCFIQDLTFNLPEKTVYVLAVGKASAEMFNSARGILGKTVAGSLVITSEEEQADSCNAQTVIIGSHPVPDDSSFRAGKKAVEFLENIPQDALIICLISGGTSSLMCLPAEGISIRDLNHTYHLLNNSGATIHEINAVRKHCSQIKGGQLLRHINSSVSLVELVISDVPNDDLSIIGSGPTVPDLSTFQDAYHILLEYSIWDKLPETVQSHIEKGMDGKVNETLKEENNLVKSHHSYIISSAKKFAQRLANLASNDNQEVWVDNKAFNANVESIAATIAKKTKAVVENRSATKPSSPRLLIFYGESYVKVTGSGKGGRNQELALWGALKIEGLHKVTWLSVGTDGIDGPTDAAGAIVDGTTIQAAHRKKIDPEGYLNQNDSYHFHKQMGTLYKTGPTGNNLMDVTLVLIE